MTVETLKTKTHQEIKNFISQRLSNAKGGYVDLTEYEPDHRRFQMSGYEVETGQCTTENLAILNAFAYLGIYDYTSYLFLDFYKGDGTLYLKYFHEEENLEFNLATLGTIEIIAKVFDLTIFSDKPKRRRI